MTKHRTMYTKVLPASATTAVNSVYDSGCNVQYRYSNKKNRHYFFMPAKMLAKEGEQGAKHATTVCIAATCRRNQSFSPPAFETILTSSSFCLPYVYRSADS